MDRDDTEVNHSIGSLILDLIKRERQHETTDYSGLISPTIQFYIVFGMSDFDELRVQLKTEFSSDEIVSSLKGKIQGNLGLYIKLFEGKFLQETDTFYKELSIEYLHKHSISEYLAMFKKKLKEEQDRCIRYMVPHTIYPLNVTLNKVLIGEHIDILREGIDKVIVNGDYDDLIHIYNLCNDISAVKDKLGAVFRNNIVTYGMKFINNCY
uniref:Cullin domain-containing protein n=1 Tax=Strongyloides papillosus TaxID=174720 RepID=A0A0N5B2U3_STREA